MRLPTLVILTAFVCGCTSNAEFNYNMSRKPGDPSYAEFKRASAERDAKEKRLYEERRAASVARLGFRVGQIVDANNMLVSIVDDTEGPRVFWMTGYPTGSLVDGDNVVLTCKTTGTKQYESAFGKRTVTLLQYVAWPASTEH